MRDLAWAFLLFAGLVLLALPQAANLPLIDRDEPRFCEASREMIERGDYVVPFCNGVPRYQKPPFIYWCQVLAYNELGDTELAARLPSVLASVGVGVLLYGWARRAGCASGMAAQAGIITVLSAQMIQQGRVATADALLLFWMTLANWLGWEWRNAQHNRFLLWLGLVLSLSAGFLTKGPGAWLPCVGLLFFVISVREGLAVVAAVLASLGPVMIWALPTYWETHGDYLSEAYDKHLIPAVTTSTEGHGFTTVLGYLWSLPYYFVLFWISALPWSPFLALKLGRLTRGWHDPLNRYLLVQTGIVYLVFSLMVTKLPHYTLPALPLLALIFIRKWKDLKLSDNFRYLPGYCALALGVIVALASFFGQELSPAKNLVEQAHSLFTPEMRFGTVTYHEGSVTWEMRRYVKGFQQELGAPEAAAFLAAPGPQALFIPTKEWADLGLHNDQWKLFQTHALNTGKFKPEDLTLVVKATDAPAGEDAPNWTLDPNVIGASWQLFNLYEVDLDEYLQKETVVVGTLKGNDPRTIDETYSFDATTGEFKEDLINHKKPPEKDTALALSGRLYDLVAVKGSILVNHVTYGIKLPILEDSHPFPGTLDYAPGSRVVLAQLPSPNYEPYLSHYFGMLSLPDLGLNNKEIAEQIKTRKSPKANIDNNIFFFVDYCRTFLTSDVLSDEPEIDGFLNKIRSDGVRLQVATLFMLEAKDDALASKRFLSLVKYVQRNDVTIDMLKNIAIGYLTVPQKARLDPAAKAEFHDYIVKKLNAAKLTNIRW